jgi:hypothetical protein
VGRGIHLPQADHEQLNRIRRHHVRLGHDNLVCHHHLLSGGWMPIEVALSIHRVHRRHDSFDMEVMLQHGVGADREQHGGRVG